MFWGIRGGTAHNGRVSVCLCPAQWHPITWAGRSPGQRSRARRTGLPVRILLRTAWWQAPSCTARHSFSIPHSDRIPRNVSDDNRKLRVPGAVLGALHRFTYFILPPALENRRCVHHPLSWALRYEGLKELTKVTLLVSCGAGWNPEA